jgi:hypothetical protein
MLFTRAFNMRGLLIRVAFSGGYLTRTRSFLLPVLGTLISRTTIVVSTLILHDLKPNLPSLTRKFCGNMSSEW